MPSLDEEKAKQDPSYYLKNTNTETRETLQELYKEFKGDEVLAATMRVPEKAKVDKLNAVSGGAALPGRTPGVRCWGGLPAASVVPHHRAAGAWAGMALRSWPLRARVTPGCRAAGEGGQVVPGCLPLASPACPTPVLVLGPGSPSPVRALRLVPWPVEPSAAPAPTRRGLGHWGGKMLNITHYQRNANQNHYEVPFHASQNGCNP